MQNEINSKPVDFSQLNGVTLAYVGDAIYEIYIRTHLINSNITKPNELQKLAPRYVSAKAQAALLDLMKEDGILTKEEWYYVKRGRNAKSYTHAKNTPVVTYRMSTGFEALLGYLSLNHDNKRLNEIISWCIKQIDEGKINHDK